MANRASKTEYDHDFIGDVASPAPRRMAPGKRTLTALITPTPLPAAPPQYRTDPSERIVQMKREANMRQWMNVLMRPDRYETPASDDGTRDLRETAAQGVSGSGTSLPYLDQIQEAFGAHDISGVKAHVGGNAAEAAKTIGAQAYATGNNVAFAGAPDLHTAAHEAAHVVQQRAGVQLKGGVGEDSDAYERHADAVADAVVQGKSAEPILDEIAGKSRLGAEADRRLSPAVQCLRIKELDVDTDDVEVEVLIRLLSERWNGVGWNWKNPEFVKDSFGKLQPVNGFSPLEAKALRDKLGDQIDLLPADARESLRKYAGWSLPCQEGLSEELENKITSGDEDLGPEAVRTHYGIFHARLREPISSRGMRIELHFTPTDIECESIGLVQIARTTTNNVVETASSPTKKARQTNDGYHVDAHENDTNPLYGMRNLPPGEDLANSESCTVEDELAVFRTKRSATPPDEPTGGPLARLGHRRKSGPTWDVRDAYLFDRPGTRAGGQQQFETAAICLSGTMQGTYLGSVRWGYSCDPRTGEVTLLDFSVGGMGTPSPAWRAAAQKWNDTPFLKTETDEDKWGETEVVDDEMKPVSALPPW